MEERETYTTGKEVFTFAGCPALSANFSKLPNVIIDNLHLITSLGELKCILYILRHTFGFGESRKRISTDEFVHGRKQKGGKRFDKGTGLSPNTVRDGLRRAVEHGFLIVEINNRDKARVTKYYSIKMENDE